MEYDQRGANGWPFGASRSEIGGKMNDLFSCKSCGHLSTMPAAYPIFDWVNGSVVCVCKSCVESDEADVVQRVNHAKSLIAAHDAQLKAQRELAGQIP